MGETQGDQKVEQTWETPSLEDIAVGSHAHAQAMQASDDEAVWFQAGMPFVLIRTIGRRSGAEHFVPLPTWRDPEGRRVVVASYAGAVRHPAWYLNLADRDANPEVLCQVPGRQFWSRHEILEGDEYDRIWPLLTADRAWYVDYQAKTARRIPLIRLPESGPG
jgi:deazaflavin-dependent oxidoreductase (nitroreductase family)